MATLTYTYPNAEAAALVDALCWKFSYQAMVPGPGTNMIPNPETRAAFAKRMGAEFFKNIHREYKVEMARQQLPAVPPLDVT